MGRPVKNGIKLSHKYGVNPATTVCFFCGRETGIAMLGMLKGDAKAPRRIVANYIPCDECKEKHKQGRVIIEAVQTPNGLPEIQKGVWPTGRWCMISREAGQQLFKDGVDTPVLLENNLYRKLVNDNE